MVDSLGGKKMDLKEYIASIPDYPQEGIIFRDISPLMADGEAYRYATQQIVEYAQEKGLSNATTEERFAELLEELKKGE